MKMFTRRLGSFDNRGMALIGVLVLSALLMSLALTLAMLVRSDTQLRGAFGSGVTGFYAAESGLNAGMGEYRNIFLDYNVPNGSDFNARTLTVGNRSVTYKMTERAGNPQNIIIPAGQVFTGLNAQQYRYIVNSASKNVNNDVEAGVGAEFLVGYIPLFQFVAFYKNDLEILPGATMVLNGRVHTNGNLYLNSDASLTIADNPAAGVTTVQVSAGHSIYRGRKNDNSCNGTVTVDKLQDIVAPFSDLDPKVLPCSGGTRDVPQAELAAWKGSLIRDLGNIAIPEPDIIKPPSSVSNGGTGDPGVYWDKADLRIVMHLRNGQLPAGPILPYDIEVTTKSGVTDVARTLALKNFMLDGNWNNRNTVGRGPSNYRGTMPIFVTDLPFAGGGCAANAPCAAAANVLSYAPQIGAPLPGPAPLPNLRTFVPAAATGAYTELMGQGNVTFNGPFTFDRDYRRGGFYNWREQKWMLLLNINVRDLILWNSQNGEPFFSTTDSSEGGIVIFATIDGPDSNRSNNNYGIRIFGSNDLPLAGGIGVSADPTGVTIATDQAIYVLGDFNRGTAAGGAPRQPASIIGDSVNMMSEAYWARTVGAAPLCGDQFCRDGQSTQALTGGRRNSQNTWINAAFLSGIDDTLVGTYNGGLENYPRFHENWSGTTLNYQGAFVSLGNTEHVNGIWCGTGSTCNIYNPPTRLWNFDPGYNAAENLPPLTPRFVYVQQVLFTEDFK